MIPYMSNSRAPKDPRNYRVGIDAGTNSVGLSAIEFDDEGNPISILAATSFIHDSGVIKASDGTTRLAAAGVARRTRRMLRRRVKRLVELDRKFVELGWPEPEPTNDPYEAWRARAHLATERIDDGPERQAMLVRALRHMARHRGWRNPYSRVEGLLHVNEPSEFFDGFQHRVQERTGHRFSGDVTIAELAVTALDFPDRAALRMGRAGKSKPGKTKQEKPFSYLGGKLMQSDNANEIHAYARTQELDPELVDELIRLVFKAESPRGSHIKRIGKDPLTNQPRAPKASDAFQRFRIASTLANIRVNMPPDPRPLTPQERKSVFEFLVNLRPTEQATWGDAAKIIGVPRTALTGAASLDDEWEERLPLRPPAHVTNQNVRQAPKALTSIRDWWTTATREERDALISALVDGGVNDEDPAASEAKELLNALSEDELTALDNLDLPAGRAAYSLEALRALTERMLNSDEDLHEARKSVYGVDDAWQPPKEPIGAPTGNPTVDRVTKIVSRWLLAAESEWGSPTHITIEHVREAFMSAKTRQELDREMRRRFEQNERQRLQIKSSEKLESRVTISDVRRFDAITRQKGQCAYCGDVITFTTAEMDHVVPRKGVGSTNTRSNLLAVCIPCNRSKGNLPFAVWAESEPRPNVSVEEAVKRTRHWTRDKGLTVKSWNLFLKEVKERLERTYEDPEIDGRSMESVSWMANELRGRIAEHFSDAGTKVVVYQGAVTAGARAASGIDGKIPFIGGGGKTRFDRRHHAVDAAVVTLLDESIARTLAERNNLRVTNRFDQRSGIGWKEYQGSSPRARQRFTEWRARMYSLTELLTTAFAEDRIVVTENLRLRLANGRVHEDTVRPFTSRRPVSSSFSRTEIDASATPAQWTALSRDPEFDPKSGLPENPTRRLRIRGEWYEPDDLIPFFDKPRAAIAVRDGWAELGDSIHHARIYRWEERGTTRYGMLRVFTADLSRYRGQDLFNIDPMPSWVSVRAAHPSISMESLSQKEYMGWLVPGDELLINMQELLELGVGEATVAMGLGSKQRWKVVGFEDPGRINLTPLYTAKEGLDNFFKQNPHLTQHRKSVESIHNKWRISVNKLFAKGNPIVIRRDSLGRPRLRSKAHLPTCWYTR